MMPALVLVLVVLFVGATVGVVGSVVYADDAARLRRRLLARNLEVGKLRELAAKQRRESHALRSELVAVKTELFRVKWRNDAQAPDGGNAVDGGSDGGA